MPQYKPAHSRRTAQFRSNGSRLGFTAIEISAVATIIAILALILIPIVRNRVDESKIVAAQDDMTAIEKAQQIAHGYTGHYFRLQDLYRLTPDMTVSDTAKRLLEAKKAPQAFWDRALFNQVEANSLIANWKGPFFTGQRSRTSTVAAYVGAVWTSVDGSPAADLPVKTYSNIDDNDWIADDGNALLRTSYPIDPWGNPYFFFGPETDYSKAVIISMGPDGMPGKAYPHTPDNFRRQNNILGSGDDIIREFD